jgi:serine/threonine protein kinase
MPCFKRDSDVSCLDFQVCAEGSLFDFYRSQKAFDMATKMRIAKECCRGMKAIHDIGYMHR